MLNTLNKFLIVFLVISFWGCTPAGTGDTVMREEIITAVVAGSAESPDPVLKKVQELEKKGILKNVIVMESFPVQISVTGPKRVVEQLKAMPRKKLPNFN